MPNLGNRRGPSPEHAARINATLRQRYERGAVAGAPPSGAKAVPFTKDGYASYDIYLEVTFDGAGGTPYQLHSLGDSGFNSIQMCCTTDLDSSKYTVINQQAKSPFGWHPSWIVKGPVSLKLVDGTMYKIEDVEFYACKCKATDWSCRNTCNFYNFGLGMVEQFDSGIYAAFSPIGGAKSTGTPRPVLSFDYQGQNLLLLENQEAVPQCGGKWLKVLDSPWTALHVEQLQLSGVKVENWVTSGTEAFLDTGGGPTYLQWGYNGETTDPFPPPAKNVVCPNPSYFNTAWKSDPSYSDCRCYYSKEVTWGLFDERGQKMDAVFNQAQVHALEGSPPLDTTPTLITCRKANVGDGNWANLGGVFFHLYPITFDYKTQEACIES